VWPSGERHTEWLPFVLTTTHPFNFSSATTLRVFIALTMANSVFVTQKQSSKIDENVDNL
jgi:hypothetical protein